MLLDAITSIDDYDGIKVDLGGGGGYKTGHDGGDLLVGRAQDVGILGLSQGVDHIETRTDLFIIEEKYKKTDANKYLQEKGDKFDAMIDFSHAIGATPVLAVRWSSNLDWSPGAKHLLQDAREVRRTKSGNVSVKPQTAIDHYQTVEEFFK
jgi:Holliday junction resolvase